MRTGGAERHWATLVPALRERGVEAGVLCLAGEGPFFGELRARGVPVTSIRMRGRFDLRGWRRALACAATRPDVVVTRGVSAQLVGARIARRAGARHVLNEHTPGQGGRAARPAATAPARAHAGRDAARGRGHRGERQPGRAARGARLPEHHGRAERRLRGRRRGRGALARVRGRRLRGAVRLRAAAREAGRRVHRGGAGGAAGERRRSAATSPARAARTSASRRSPAAAASSCSACAPTRSS